MTKKLQLQRRSKHTIKNKMAPVNKLARSAAQISIVLLVLVKLSIASNNSSSLIDTDPVRQQAVQTSEPNYQNEATEEPKRASQRQLAAAGSGRSGRMLDLDVLAGDIGKQEKAAKERSLSGNRQSRNLAADSAISDNGAPQKVEGRSPKKTSNKKMSIKGFIPIVSLENGKHFDPSQMMGSDSDDDNNDNDSGETESTNGQNEQHNNNYNNNNNLREHLANNYGGHTSIGHASFVQTPISNNQQQQQQYANEPQWQQMVASQQQQQYLAPQDQLQPESGRVNRKLGASGILSGLAGGVAGTKRGLVSSLVPSSISSANFAGAAQYNNPYQQLAMANHLSGPMNLPPLQAPFGLALDSSQGGDCICVPFFQCKNGFLSESQLSKTQLAQLNQLSSPVHQIPRSLDNFKVPASSLQTQNAAPSGYNQYPSQQQQQSQMFTAADQMHQLQQQQQQGVQSSQQQQFVNDMIYDQLRKGIEGSNLEQQLQQQEAYNDANQQQLALIDERHAKCFTRWAAASCVPKAKARGMEWME